MNEQVNSCYGSDRIQSDGFWHKSHDSISKSATCVKVELIYPKLNILKDWQISIFRLNCKRNTIIDGFYID